MRTIQLTKDEAFVVLQVLHNETIVAAIMVDSDTDFRQAMKVMPAVKRINHETWELMIPEQIDIWHLKSLVAHADEWRDDTISLLQKL